MQCPACEKFIEDNSNHCPHCGAAVERTFCSECGQPIGGEKSSSGGLVLVFILVFGIMLVILSSQQKTVYLPSSTQQNTTVSQPAQQPAKTIAKPYEVISANSVSFEDLQTVESRISLRKDAPDNLYIESVKSIINEQKNQNPMTIVVVYAYEDGVYEESPLDYKLKATYVNTDLNPDFDTALLQDQQALPGHIYLKWRGNSTGAED